MPRGLWFALIAVLLLQFLVARSKRRRRLRQKSARLNGAAPKRLTSAEKALADEKKGEAGEELVRGELESFGTEEDYQPPIHNVVIPLENGRTTEIDHVLISRFGVFVIETKNWSGWLFGDARERRWTQAFSRGKNASTQNPVEQNRNHLRALASHLGVKDTHCFSVIVLVGNVEFKTTMPDNVVRLNGLRRHIEWRAAHSFRRFSPEQMRDMARRLWPLAAPERRQAHKLRVQGQREGARAGGQNN